MNTLRWTSRDLELLPDNGKRYEIVDGELYVSRKPDMQHQIVCSRLGTFLNIWSIGTGLGEAIGEPGLVFADDDDVVPDVVWISHERFATAIQPDGKFHSCPELVIETLSPGSINVRRDRDFKRKLYSRRGTEEYCVVNWQERTIKIYSRENAVLKLDRILNENDVLTTPLLSGFSRKVSQLLSSVLWEPMHRVLIANDYVGRKSVTFHQPCERGQLPSGRDKSVPTRLSFRNSKHVNAISVSISCIVAITPFISSDICQ